MAHRNANDEIVLTENEVDFLVQNILPLYENEMEEAIKKVQNINPNVEQMLLRNFRNAINKAQTLRHQLDA